MVNSLGQPIEKFRKMPLILGILMINAVIAQKLQPINP